MSIFGETYSEYYDLLYKEKDYTGESHYIHKLISKYKPESKSILELGCGTGKHASVLKKMGYKIAGIDISDKMLSEAKKNYSDIDFIEGDIRIVRLHKKYDVVVSLFHVLNYQKENKDLLDTFETAEAHLKSGGLFIFDCWYGPAVLSEKPSNRVKRLENENIRIVRICEPVIYPNENYVDVNYEIIIENKTTNKVHKINETHSMRYLFKPEIEIILQKNNLELINYEEWMTGKAAGLDTWGVCFVGIKS